MRNVWKIGSRWDDNGALGTSILDAVFIPNGVVFATTTLCLEIAEGDLFAVADGYKVVAIAEALTPGFRMDRLNPDLHPNPQSFKTYLFADNYGCKVRIFKLDNQTVFEYKKMGKLTKVSADITKRVNCIFATQSQKKRSHNRVC